MTHADSINWALALSWGALAISVASVVLTIHAIRTSNTVGNTSCQLVKDSTDTIVHQVQLVLGAFEAAGFIEANRNDRREIIGYKVHIRGSATASFSSKAVLHVPDGPPVPTDPE